MAHLASAFHRTEAADDEARVTEPFTGAVATPEVDQRMDLTLWLALGGRFDPSVSEAVQSAEAAKARGNELFAASNIDEAIREYSDALDLLPLDKAFDEQRVRTAFISPACTPVLCSSLKVFHLSGYLLWESGSMLRAKGRSGARGCVDRYGVLQRRAAPAECVRECHRRLHCFTEVEAEVCEGAAAPGHRIRAPGQA